MKSLFVAYSHKISEEDYMKITMYTIPNCVYCKMAKDYFGDRKIDIEEINVFQNKDAAKEMIDKSGQMGVPVLDIGGKIIVGYDEREMEKALDDK